MQQSFSGQALTLQGHRHSLTLEAQLETCCCRHDSRGPDPTVGAHPLLRQAGVQEVSLTPGSHTPSIFYLTLVCYQKGKKAS